MQLAKPVYNQLVEKYDKFYGEGRIDLSFFLKKIIDKIQHEAISNLKEIDDDYCKYHMEPFRDKLYETLDAYKGITLREPIINTMIENTQERIDLLEEIMLGGN